MRILLGEDIPAQRMPELFSSYVAAEAVSAVAALGSRAFYNTSTLLNIRNLCNEVAQSPLA